MITACYSNLCDQTHVIVNDGPPRLTVIEPEFGAAIDGEEGPGIVVSGTVFDDGDELTLSVNGQVVEVADDGAFETVIDAQFGMNSITVIADDGLSIERTVVVRDVLWSSQYAPSDPCVNVTFPAVIRVDQRLFDANETFDIPSDGGIVNVEGVSNLSNCL